MAIYRYGLGERNLVQINAADVVELLVYAATSTTDPTPKTGLAFGSVSATYCKGNGTAFSAWPASPGWGTGNWSEVGNGVYRLIITGSVAAELALLDTTGPLLFNLTASGAFFPVVQRIVEAAPLVRVGTGTGQLNVSGGDIAGKVLGGGSGTITGTGARVVDASGNDVAPASIFAGITSLAAWLRGLFRKDAMDATAKTEVNTDGGAYNEATDSNEALRDTEPLGTPMRGTDNAEASGAAAAAVAGLHDFDPANDTVAHVALVDTTTTNTDMRGTNGAYTGTPPSAADIADAIFDEAMSGHTAAGTFGRYMRDIFARMGLGIVTDSGARTIKVYDGLDPATANLLFTLTATVSGNTVTWVRS